MYLLCMQKTRMFSSSSLSKIGMREEKYTILTNIIMVFCSMMVGENKMVPQKISNKKLNKLMANFEGGATLSATE